MKEMTDIYRYIELNNSLTLLESVSGYISKTDEINKGFNSKIKEIVFSLIVYDTTNRARILPREHLDNYNDLIDKSEIKKLIDTETLSKINSDKLELKDIHNTILNLRLYLNNIKSREA